jgi:hypothetical protein
MARAKTEGPLSQKILSLSLLVALVAAGLMFSAGPAHARTFTVNNTADVGNGICNESGCTLNEAIGSANDNPGADAIGFDIPGSGVRTIAQNSPLPDITGPVTIDGYTQPGSRKNTRAIGGLDAVVLIELSGTGSGLDILASGVVVRGLAINRGSGSGIGIRSGTGSRIEGNYIGTDPGGTLDRGNFCFGVVIDGGGEHTVGGTTAAARNLISGNNCDGVEISDNSKGGNKVQGNLIGTQGDGTSPLGNSDHGMLVNSDDNLIGGAEPGAANTIAFNVRNGMFFESSASSKATCNRILGNSVFSNGGVGIDLEGGIEDAAGRTANDPGDSDAGPNALQNFPLLSSASVSDAGTTEIAGTLESTPSTKRKKKTFTIQFFSNPSTSDEGKTFLGQKKVTTNRRGQASFSFEGSVPVGAGESMVTATATGPGGNTSEFSAPRVVVRP